MRKVSRNTGGVDDIEEGQLVDERRDLAEKRERLWVLAGTFYSRGSGTAYLANATRSTKNSSLDHVGGCVV